MDAQQICRALSDADAATSFLSRGLEPLPVCQRYLADVARGRAKITDADEMTLDTRSSETVRVK